VNPGELAIELFCLGMRLDGDPSGRPISRTRAGLGSGLELVLPGARPLRRDIWINVAVLEEFAAKSPFRLRREESLHFIEDERDKARYSVRLPPEPAWYRQTTARGVEMQRIGVLQGTYLGIYVCKACQFWGPEDPSNCRFCTTGVNVGRQEEAVKDIDDVVETALAAKEQSGVTFVHLNTGYQGGEALKRMAPYVRALKERVGVLVGVQAVPEGPFEEYDRLIELGCDHFSFCVEFHDPEIFAKYCPGKQKTVGQRRFFDALAYCQRRMPRGACSGELIAGLEPPEETIAAIEEITGLGAFPTVCIFRPLIGSAMADAPPPDPGAMKRILRRVWECCRDKAIPIGMAPNIEVSLVMQPTDAAYLSDWTWRDKWYAFSLGVKRRLAAPIFRRRLALRTPSGA